VLDNLPVHLVEQRDGSLRELCVGVGQEGFELVGLPPSSPELGKYLERCGVELPEGHRFEVGLAAESFVSRVGQMFQRGCGVFVDYGDDALGLSQRPLGSLVAYSASGVDDHVLDAPGEKDITAHANWTAVLGACRRAGLEPFGPSSQRAVLETLGLHELHDSLRARYAEAIADGRGADAVGALSRRQALGALADRGGLGGLQTLVGTRAIEPPDFIRNEEGTGHPVPSS